MPTSNAESNEKLATAEQYPLFAAIEGIALDFKSRPEGLASVTSSDGDLIRKALSAGDFDGFYFAAQYPASCEIDRQLAREFPGDKDAIRFLFKHSQFIERHLETQIKRHEGSVCAADKSGTVMRLILRFLQTGTEISYDYAQQYTYHLPNVIFKRHDSTIQFFYSLQHLYYGDPKPLISALMTLEMEVSATPTYGAKIENY